MTKHQPRIAIGISLIDPLMHVAEVVAGTATIFALENYDQFTKWINEKAKESDIEPEHISQKMLMMTAHIMASRAPEDLFDDETKGEKEDREKASEKD